MTFKLLTFGVARDVIGEDMMIDHNLIQDVAALRSWLESRYPHMRGVQRWAFAVNETYAEDHTPIRSGDVVAVIPPVSGG
jgi:sulfur-carrier protein